MDAPSTFPDLTRDEQVFLEACLARRREMIALGRKAASGRVLAECEEAVMPMAQATARELMSAGIEEAVAEAEKKGPRPGPVRVATAAATAAPTNGPS